MAHANRIESIDTLRGADMFMLAVGAALIGSGARLIAPAGTTQVIVHQLTHANWGATLTCWDMVMPLFIFIVGASMPFAFTKYRERGGDRWYWSTSWRVLRRVVLLFLLGMLVQGNLCSAQPDKMDLFCNTLQAIAEGYLIAAVVLMAGGGLRAQVATSLLCLVLYWVLLRWVPYAGQPGGLFLPDNNLAIYIDRALQGSWADGTPYSWILTSLSFGALTLMGCAGGEVIRRFYGMKSVLLLLGSGLTCLLGGMIVACDTPIIKHIYTSSAVLWCGGWCLLLLGVFHLVFDFRPWLTPLAFPFKVIGCNAMLAYLLTQTPGLHGYSLWNSLAAPLFNGIAQHCGDARSFVYHLLSALLFWLVFYFLYRHRAYLRV